MTYFKDTFGGVERATYNLTRGLVRCGHRVVVYTSAHRNGIVGRHKVDGVIIYSSSNLEGYYPTENIDEHISRSIKRNKTRIAVELTRILHQERPRYILSVDDLWGILTSLNMWSQLQARTGLLFHMAIDRPSLHEAFRCPFDDYYAVSPHLRNQIQLLSSEARRTSIDIVPNSVELEKVKIRKGSGRVVFCNARLAFEKGVDLLLEAFPKVLEMLPDAKLWLCSGNFHFASNEEATRLVKAEIERNSQLGNAITLLPQLRWDDVWSVLACSSVVVLPSREESFGMSALEAMASKVPVVASTSGNLPSLVGSAGLLLDPHDTASLAFEIIRVLDDDGLAAELGERGAKIASQYEYRRIAREFARDLNRRISS